MRNPPVPTRYPPADRGAARARGGRGTPTPKILAVDDSASARKVFQGVLLRLGVGLPDLRFASNSAEALQLFAQWRPDLVFVDIELHAAGARAPAKGPGAANGGEMVDGDELAKQILDRNPRQSIVLVTAYDRDHPRVKALLEKGAADVIVKPILAGRVQEVLEQFSGVARDDDDDLGAPRRR